MATSSDAGCQIAQVGSANTPTATGTNLGTCGDPVLTGGTPATGATSTPVETDDAGDSGVEPSGSGGIWVPPAGHVLNPDPDTGATVTGETGSAYTVTGLTNNVEYTVVIAAVDGSGNVGLPSTQECASPAPINDFFMMYQNAGGKAGGGCALEAAGAPATPTFLSAGLGVAVVARLRRKRRRSR